MAGQSGDANYLYLGNGTVLYGRVYCNQRQSKVSTATYYMGFHAQHDAARKGHQRHQMTRESLVAPIVHVYVPVSYCDMLCTYPCLVLGLCRLCRESNAQQKNPMYALCIGNNNPKAKITPTSQTDMGISFRCASCI